MPPATFHLQFETRSDFGYLPFLTQIFKRLGVRKAPVLTQILVEAYNNAVVHGNRRKREKWVGVTIVITKQKVKINVVDEGLGMKRIQPNDDLLRSSGRGLQLIHALSRKVTSRKKGGRHIFEATV